MASIQRSKPLAIIVTAFLAPVPMAATREDNLFSVDSVDYALPRRNSRTSL